MAEQKTPTPTLGSPDTAWFRLIDTVKNPNSGFQLGTDMGSGQSMVYQGGVPVLVLPSEKTGKFDSVQFRTVDEAALLIRSFGSTQIKQLQKQLGLPVNGQMSNDFVKTYLDYANRASVQNYALANMQAKGMATIGTTRPFTLATISEIEPIVPTVSRSVSIKQFSEGEARGILEEFYAEAVGRRPSNKEVKSFLGKINAAAKAKPTTSTTTYGRDGGSTTVSGGAGYQMADAQIAARQQAEADPEASSFLASTKYMDAFMDAIKSQV